MQIFFVADVFLNFRTSFYDANGFRENRPERIVKNYMKWVKVINCLSKTRHSDVKNEELCIKTMKLLFNMRLILQGLVYYWLCFVFTVRLCAILLRIRWWRSVFNGRILIILLRILIFYRKVSISDDEGSDFYWHWWIFALTMMNFVFKMAILMQISRQRTAAQGAFFIYINEDSSKGNEDSSMIHQ